MPVYEFECKSCGNRFTVEESMSEHQQHNEKCPKCGSLEIEQLVSPVSVKTSRKS